MAVENFPLEQNHFSNSSTAFEELNKDPTSNEVQISPLHSPNIDFDSSTTFQISNQTVIPFKQDSNYRSIPHSRESLDPVTSLETLEIKKSAETECPLVADTTTSSDLDIVKQLDSVDDTNITPFRDLSSSPIAIPLIVFPFSKTNEDGSSESGYAIVGRDPPRSTSVLPTIGTRYQRLVDLQNLYNRNSILDKIASDIHGTPPHREEPTMQSLFTPHYPDEQRILEPGNSETDLKLWDLGFHTRTLARSIRDSPHRTPTLIRYRMVGDHRIFLSYFTRKHIHEREKLAWNKISSILSPDFRNAPLSPGFEKLATDFFSGKMVLEDYGDASELSTGTVGSEMYKNHNITYDCSDISDEDKRKCLHDPAFAVFIQDLVMCNDLEKAKNNETTWHGARVLGQLEDESHLDDINVKSLLNILSGMEKKQSGTEEGGSGSQPLSFVVLNPSDIANTRDSDTVVTPSVTTAAEVALPQPTQGPQLNGQEPKDAKYDDEWMNFKEAATIAKESKKSSNKRNKNRKNQGSKKPSQVNSTISGNGEESQSPEDSSLKRQMKGKGLSQPCSSLEIEPDEALQKLQKFGNLNPLGIPRGYGDEDGEWLIVQPKSSYKLGRGKKASTHGAIRNIGLPQRGTPRPLIGNPELSKVTTICDGNDDVDSTSVSDYPSEDLKTACIECGNGNSDEGVGVDCEPSNIPLLSDIGNLAPKVDWEEKLTDGSIPTSSGAASEGATPIEELSKAATIESCNRSSANVQDAESRADLETQDGDEVENVTYESTVPISLQCSDEDVLAASENDPLNGSGVSAQTVDFVGTDSIHIKLASISAMESAEEVSAQNFLVGSSTRTDIPNFICESSESDTEEHEEMNLAVSNPDIGVMATCNFCGECLDPRVETPQILCSGCGVSGEGNYCSVACLLVDAYDHSSHCMGHGAFSQAPFNDFPVYSLYIPNPITPLIGYHETPDRFRQRAFSMYCWSGVFPKLSMAWTKKYGDALPNSQNFDATEEAKRTGDYAIFRSELTCPGPRRNPHGDVIFTIKLLVDDPRKQMLNRALNACFLLWEPQVAEFLYRLLKNIILHTESFLLFKYREPLEVVYMEFKNQFCREFGFHETMATIHTEFNLWQEWQPVGPLLWKLESWHPILVDWVR